jgi:hypothetical protein
MILMLQSGAQISTRERWVEPDPDVALPISGSELSGPFKTIA